MEDNDSEEESDSDDEPLAKRKKQKKEAKPKSRGTKRSAKQRTQPGRDARKVYVAPPTAP